MRFPSLKHLALAAIAVLAGCGQNSSTGPQVIEEGQPPVIIHPTVEAAQAARGPDTGIVQDRRPHGASNLFYGGGIGGIGVETAPKVYVVWWGSQWGSNCSNDPSGEAGIQQNFFNHAGGSSWANSVTQYCQGVASGTVFCNGAGQAAGNQPNQLAGTWCDNGSAAPSSPTQSQLAGEAVNAAAHFGNTTAASNGSVQYVISTATGNSSSGFGTQYCAYHSSTSSSFGNIAYTNMPYITDAGASCGANFNGLGPNAGITIVGGHEYAETISDQFPNGGWLDSRGAENGDKCAWIASGQGASANVTMNGATFPVQSLWSNAFNSNAGGCVLSYP
jgi:serine protease